jgi:hypothetical protein
MIKSFLPIINSVNFIYRFYERWLQTTVPDSQYDAGTNYKVILYHLW